MAVWSGVTRVRVLVAIVFLAFFSLWTGNPAAAQQPEKQNQALPLQTSQLFYQPYYYPYPQVRRKKRRKRKRVITKKCSFPWTYSRGLRKCICVRSDYAVHEGNCVKVADICSENARWSETEKKCRCNDGFADAEGKCVPSSSGTAAYNPAEGGQCLWPRVPTESGAACTCALGYREDAGVCIADGNPVLEPRRRTTKNELLTDDVTLIQICLKEAGYLRADVRSRMGKKAWSAYWFFKQDHSIGRTPKGVHNAKAQQKLFTLCPVASAKLDVLPAAAGQPVQGPGFHAPLPGVAGKRNSTPSSQKQLMAAPPAQKQAKLTAKLPAAREVRAPVKKVYARPEAGCLPDDLYQLVVRTYGARPKLKQCTQTCIAMPANITKREAEGYEARGALRWCRACIEIGSHLPLDDILRIERGANVQVCTRPPSRSPKWVSHAGAVRPVFTRARALYRPLPPAIDNKKAFAVIIGNSTYGKGLPANVSASSSAGAMYALLTEQLGYEQDHIIDLRDATLEGMTEVLGSADDHKGKLWKLLRKEPEAEVLVYFAGHAGTRSDFSAGYLLPADAVKYREDRTGYALTILYTNLEKLGARSTLLVLETSFSRDLSGFVFPPNLPGDQVRILPAEPIKGVTVLTAASGDQKTMDDPKFGIGLFTRYLIEGLAGRADLEPIGNNDGKIDTVELYAYTSHMVRLVARKSFGLLQRPVALQSGNVHVSRLQSQGQ
ncbi:MAG: caspase family protein [Hyphomicrobiaceae bacterium]|nr:caspase family protein [Hyphomicrobiaceae bacterium]